MDEPLPLDEGPLRLAASPREAADIGLVLASQFISCRVVPRDDVVAIYVHPVDFVRADAALLAYEREEAARAGVVASPARTSSMAGWVVAGVLGLFFLASGRRDLHSWFFAQGGADLGNILAGQWWRLCTALTLHADFAHLLGNCAATVIFVSAVVDQLGPGVGLFSILITGLAGNALTAVLARPPHISVGFSTALFGALGILAIGNWDGVSPRTRWLRFMGAVALLGMLGVGERADVLAHVLGFATGLALGWALRMVKLSRAPRVTSVTLQLVTLATVAVSWLCAYRHR